MQNETETRMLLHSRRPKAPKTPIQCPWCDQQPAMAPGRLSQHIKNEHPLQWKGNIYESLPPDFDYGQGPLTPEERHTLIRYGQYAANNYRKRRRTERRQRATALPESVWLEAKRAYEAGEGTYRELAKRFGVAAGTLSSHFHSMRHGNNARKKPKRTTYVYSNEMEKEAEKLSLGSSSSLAERVIDKVAEKIASELLKGISK